VSLVAWRLMSFFVVLQAFIRDAEYVDSLSASHEAFLSNDDRGVYTDLFCSSFKTIESDPFHLKTSSRF